MARFVVLLRGVNVGGGRKLPMAELRAAVRAGGYPDATTYIASGNLVLSTDESGAILEGRIEALIQAAFGLRVEGIARTGAALAALVDANPFPDALPKLLHVGFAKRPLAGDVTTALAPKLTHGERVAIAGGELWIDFAASGVAKSKLTPAALDRAAGATVTARNINTVRALAGMAAA